MKAMPIALIIGLVSCGFVAETNEQGAEAVSEGTRPLGGTITTYRWYQCSCTPAFGGVFCVLNSYADSPLRPSGCGNSGYVTNACSGSPPSITTETWCSLATDKACCYDSKKPVSTDPAPPL
jgi:hypothetical protein